MRSSLGGFFAPNVWPVIVLLLVAGAALGVGRLLAEWLPLSLTLPVIAVCLVILGIGHVKFAAARARRTQNVVAALRGIAEGTDKRRKRWASETTMGGLGEDLRVGVEHLADSVTELRRDKRRAEMVISNLSDGILAVDCQGRVTLANKSASVILGEKPSQLVGKKLEEIDLHPEITRITYECIATKTDFAVEIRMPGYQQRVMFVRAIPHRGTGTDLDCAVVTLHDVTELRRTESSQREFVSNVSHELKTPLTAIRTTAEALLSGAKYDYDVVDRFLNTIIAETDRLAVLIDDVMDLARMDSGVAASERSDVNIPEAVHRAIQVVLPQARHGKVEVDVDVADGMVFRCDELQMIHLIRNLVDNAVKYTPSRGKVDISAELRDSELVIRVSDTGIGIPHGEVDRIFERFYRVDKARSRRMGGTGLGLAIVKDIVESHGGRIDVETQLGKGSTFTVTLPVTSANAG